MQNLQADLLLLKMRLSPLSLSIFSADRVGRSKGAPNYGSVPPPTRSATSIERSLLSCVFTAQYFKFKSKSVNQLTKEKIDLRNKIAVISGVLSVIFWLWSAVQQPKFGYDSDAELQKIFKRIGWLNAIAAVLSAISVLASNTDNLLAWIC
jgi:hypothetical protein